MECSFCDFWPNAAPKKDELTTDDYRRVAKELAKIGCFAVSIEGGEPFTRPDLIEIVRALSGAGHVPMLFTNGWYVTRENAKELWAAGLVHADVSIDYPDAKRHDKKRGMVGATERAWQALEHFKSTAPHGGKQVHVMTVVMEDNFKDLERLFQKSAAAGVGQHVTLISVAGFRRGKGVDHLPPIEAADDLVRLYRLYPHVRYFESYFSTMKQFLGGRDMPTCTAGTQGFNIDHVGNVAPCIERIGESVGNVKTESVGALWKRLNERKTRDVVDHCQDCWTACRGFQQALGGGGSIAAFKDLATRMRVD